VHATTLHRESCRTVLQLVDKKMSSLRPDYTQPDEGDNPVERPVHNRIISPGV
jgi:hypothetical protein